MSAIIETDEEQTSTKVKTVPETIKQCLKSKEKCLDLSSILNCIGQEIVAVHEIHKEDTKFDSNAFSYQILQTKYKLFPFPSNLLLNCRSFLVRLTLSSWPISTDRERILYRYGTFNPNETMTVSELKNAITIPECIWDLENLNCLEMNYYPFRYLSSNLGKLKNLRTLKIGHSSVICLPREIKNLQNLYQFSTYSCSHSLHYMPYEITLCKSLKKSQMSTKALLNSHSCYLLFPPLPIYPKNEVLHSFIVSNKDLCEYLKHFLDKIVLTYELIQLIINDYFCTEIFCSNVNICGNDKIIFDYVYYGWGYKRIASYDDCGTLIRACSIKCLKHCLQNSNNQEWFVDAFKLQNTFQNSELIKYNQNILNKQYAFDVSNFTQKKYSYKLYDFDMDVYWMNFWKFNLQINFDSYEYIVDKESNKLCVQF